MLGYTASLTLYQTLTNNTQAANQTFGATMINEGVRVMLSDLPWPFLETTATAATTASTQTYTLPGNLSRLIEVYITVGSYKYTPTEVTSADDWAKLNNPASVESDAVTNYYVIGNQIQFWPTPASSSNTITYHFVQANKDMSVADYTTGTITTATNASASVVGSGTSWTAGMVGKYLRITAGNAANLGDGLWYKISAVGSATAITLSAVYTGVSISGGTANYTISDCSLVPERYQIGPVYYAAAEYFRRNGDSGNADRYERLFLDTLDRMKREEGTKGTSVVVDSGGIGSLPINPNLARFVS